MADRLGIVTRYFQHEVTQAAIHLAEVAEHISMRPTILARRVCRKEVSPYWDNRVINERKAEFNEWALQCSHIIWTAPPRAYELAWTKDHGIETILLAIWDELTAKHEVSAQMFDSIVFPYNCAANAVCKAWGGTGTEWRPRLAPWDVPIPLGESRPLPDTLTVFVPLFDSQPSRSSLPVFNVMEAIVRAMPEVHFIVASGTRWALRATRWMRRLCKIYPGRFRWVKQPNRLQRLSLYGASQLTLWPAVREGLALVGLASLCMGVPVVAWDIPPQNEYLHQNKNALLLPCDIQENWLGVPEAVVNWETMLADTLSLLQNRQLLQRMRLQTRIGLDARKQEFQASWESVLR